MKKYTIEIDEELWEFLQARAVPLIDTPNSVLRRLLLMPEGSTEARAPDMSTRALYMRAAPDLLDAETGPLASLKGRRLYPDGLSARRMGQRVMTAKFPGEYFERADRKRGGFRTMFESPDSLVYILNFNQPDVRYMLFRVTGSAIEALTSAGKKAWVIFSNPALRVAWVIPVRDVLARYRKVFKRELEAQDLVLNIDLEENRLRELDWDISGYRWDINGASEEG